MILLPLSAAEAARLMVIAREGEYDLRTWALRVLVRLPLAEDAWRELSALLVERTVQLAAAERSYLVPTMEFKETVQALAVVPLPEAEQLLRELAEQGAPPQRELVLQAQKESSRAVLAAQLFLVQPRQSGISAEDRARADALAETWLKPAVVPPFPEADTFDALRAVSPGIARRLASHLFSALSPGEAKDGGRESNALVMWIAALRSEFLPDTAHLFEAYCSQRNPDIRKQIAWAISRAPVREVVVRLETQDIGMFLQLLEQVLSFKATDPPPRAKVPVPIEGRVTGFWHQHPVLLARYRIGMDPPPAVTEAPEVNALEPMSLGLSAPPQVAPGSSFTVRFVALVERLEAEVRKILEERSPHARLALYPHASVWQPGTAVQVHLSGRYLKVRPALPAGDSFTWNGAYEIIEFDADVDEEAPLVHTVLRCDVSVVGIRVAALRVDIQISREVDPSLQPWTTFTSPFRKAFASYATENRDDVLLIASWLKSQTGMELFMDCVNLRAGQRWREQLLEAIRKCPAFVLFWSSYARRSQWVTWEWRTALEEKPESSFHVQPLEPMESAPPPKELAHLQFDDFLLRLRRASR